MKIGTKSLLFGVHQIFIHATFTFCGWIKLYGLPSWRELICIIIHDWGYWGLPNMNGEEGEKHPIWAANFVFKYLDRNEYKKGYGILCSDHSRFLAKRYGNKPSKLCWADKLGTALMPTWLWVFLARLSGEVKEYMVVEKHVKGVGKHNDPYAFFEAYKKLVKVLVYENCDREL